MTDKSELMKAGDRVTLSGFPIIYPKWWQFWKKPYDPNGAYTCGGSINLNPPPVPK